jgi:hypothetical protein
MEKFKDLTYGLLHFIPLDVNNLIFSGGLLYDILYRENMNSDNLRYRENMNSDNLRYRENMNSDNLRYRDKEDNYMFSYL